MNVREELHNWRAAHNDDWLEHHLEVDAQPVFQQYQSGKAFDEPDDPKAAPDEQLAELTERIVVHIGTQDLDIYQAMVGFWPLKHSLERIAQDMHKSVPYVKGCLNSGERLYKRLRKDWK